MLRPVLAFLKNWEDHKQDWLEEEGSSLPYLALAELGSHLISLYERNDTTEFADIFEAIERLHIEGEHYVQEAVTVGLLERIQNQLTNSGKDTELLRVYLLPVSAK